MAMLNLIPIHYRKCDIRSPCHPVNSTGRDGSRRNGQPGAYGTISMRSVPIHQSEYRNGSAVEAHVRKVPGIHKSGDVTLKRGPIRANDLFDWIHQTRAAD